MDVTTFARFRRGSPHARQAIKRIRIRCACVCCLFVVCRMCVLCVCCVCVVCVLCVCCVCGVWCVCLLYMWCVCVVRVVCFVCFVCVLCMLCVCVLCVLQGVEIGDFLRDSHSTPFCCLHLRMSTRKTVNQAHTHTFSRFPSIHVVRASRGSHNAGVEHKRNTTTGEEEAAQKSLASAQTEGGLLTCACHGHQERHQTRCLILLHR